MQISAAAGRAIYQRPASEASERPGKSGAAPGQQAKQAVETAREAGADLPRNAQGLAASAIARGAEPSSVFAALVPPPDPIGGADAVPNVPDPYPDIVAPTEVSASEEPAAAEATRPSETEGPAETERRSGTERGEQIDAARGREREVAQKEVVAEFKADDAAAQEEAVKSVAEANKADDAARARAEAVEPKAVEKRDEAASRERVAEGEEAIAAREAPREIERPREVAKAEAETTAVEKAGEVRETKATEAEKTAEARSFAEETQSERAALSAVRNAAETAYAEAIAGLIARSNGEAADRVV
jgi:hypothetical protein